MRERIITLAPRATAGQQEILLPVIHPGCALMADATELRAHAEIVLSATLATPRGGVRVELTVRGECRRVARRLRFALARPH